MPWTKALHLIKFSEKKFIISGTFSFAGEVQTLVNVGGVSFFAYSIELNFAALGTVTAIPDIESMQVSNTFDANTSAASNLPDGDIWAFAPSTGMVTRVSPLLAEIYAAGASTPNAVLTSCFPFFSKQNAIINIYRTQPDAPNLSTPAPLYISAFSWSVPPFTVSGFADESN